MAIQFIGIPTRPPLALPFAQPISLFKPSNVPPLQVAFLADWKLYNANGATPNIGIPLSLDSGMLGQSRLDRIVSVYIDNTDSNVPVAVVFPDTGFSVPCGPGNTVMQTVITNSLTPIMYGLGFTGGTQPITLFFFTNQILQPSDVAQTQFVTPQYLASVFPGNPITNQTALRALALGDLTKSVSLSIVQTFAGQTYATAASWWNAQTVPPLVTTPVTFQLSGVGQYIYITSVVIGFSGFFNVPAQAGGPLGASGYIPFISFADNLGCINLTPKIVILRPSATVITPFSNQIVLSMSNLQIKCRADATFTFEVQPFLFTGNATTGANSVTANDIGVAYLTLAYTAVDEN